MAVQNGRQHQGFVQESVDALLIRDDSDDAVLREGTGSCSFGVSIF